MNVICLTQNTNFHVTVDLDLEGVMTLEKLKLMTNENGGALACDGTTALPVTKYWQSLGGVLFKEAV